ncbi:MAG: hypothetical protein H0V47_05570 [Chloroflexia bacterium]|nr:hypothetical protein [Chloroflexia bacterium]
MKKTQRSRRMSRACRSASHFKRSNEDVVPVVVERLHIELLNEHTNDPLKRQVANGDVKLGQALSKFMTVRIQKHGTNMDMWFRILLVIGIPMVDKKITKIGVPDTIRPGLDCDPKWSLRMIMAIVEGSIPLKEVEIEIC